MADSNIRYFHQRKTYSPRCDTFILENCFDHQTNTSTSYNFALRPPRRRRKRVSRSLSSSRPEPDGRYLDTPPPYTPPRPLTPDPESDPEPPNYPENQLSRAQHSTNRPMGEPLSDSDNHPSFQSNTNPDEVGRKTNNGENIKSDNPSSAIKYLEKDTNVHSNTDQEQSILINNVQDCDDDLENKVLNNRPRNPPIISEIEEELKPGNRRKNVCHYVL